MQRWNGWGDENIKMELPPQALGILQDLIGNGQVRPDYPLEKYIDRMPPSRLTPHPLISFDARLRLDHAHGQSLPDWIGLRGGTLQHFPDGVARPANGAEVRELLKYCAAQDVIVIPYGGGTSVVGQLAVPQTERPVLSLSLERLNRLVALETENRLAVFEAGIRGPQIEQQLNSKGFTLGHYPQSFEYSSLGGWVATRSSGQQSRYYGRIEDLFAGGEIITPRGSMNLPPFPASAAGPDLRQIVLGSEGKMGVLTNTIVRITPLPESDTIYGVFFPSWEEAQKAVQHIAGTDISFSMIRLSNSLETTTNLALAGSESQISLLKKYLGLRGLAGGKFCMCLIGFTGSRRITAAARGAALSIIRHHKGVWVGKPMGRAWGKNRFRSAYLRNSLWDRGYAADTLETALTWDKVTPAMHSIEKSIHDALQAGNQRGHVFSHLSHAYASGSSIYTTYIFRLSDSPEQTFENWRRIKDAASRAIIAAGGTISHQHGVGKDHRRYLSCEKGSLGISILREVFGHVDPDQRMNPDKLLP